MNLMKYIRAVNYLIIALALSGCSNSLTAAGPPTNAIPLDTPTSRPTNTPVPPTATATLTPTATSIPTSTIDMPDMQVMLTFILPENIATGSTYEFVPYGSTYEKRPRLQKILPRYGQATLQNYPLPPDAIEEPAIRIFTTSGMMANYKNDVFAVENLLAGKENPLALYPNFPNLEFSALQTRLRLPLDFQNGSGFRYINFEVINEKDNPIPRVSVSYIYQGISADGKFYISAILPIDLPELRQKAQEILLQTLANPTPQPVESYFPEFLTELEQADDESFIPSISVLDEIIQSIEITPE